MGSAWEMGRTRPRSAPALKSMHCDVSGYSPLCKASVSSVEGGLELDDLGCFLALLFIG